MSRGFDDRRGFFNNAVPALPGVWNSWAGFDVESVFTQYPAVGRLSAAGSDSGPACPAKESQRRTAAIKGGSRQYLVRYCRAVGNSLPGQPRIFLRQRAGAEKACRPRLPKADATDRKRDTARQSFFVARRCMATAGRSRKAEPALQAFFGHEAGKVAHAAGVAPLVVVPGHQLDHLAVLHRGIGSLKNGRGRIALEVH